jgi:uncharacterized protein YbjT (DUF2867 family)
LWNKQAWRWNAGAQPGGSSAICHPDAARLASFLLGVKMTILVTGATGTIGSRVVARLVAAGADVSAMVRDPSKVKLPGAKLVKGDFLDIESLRNALTPARTLFLLNPVAVEEMHQALFALNVAREVGIERIVYLSVLTAESYTNVPHCASKVAVERMIDQYGFGATVLRPGYFHQNDLWLKESITLHDIYPFPMGGVGVATVDVDDIAEVATNELLRRDRANKRLANTRYNLVGPDRLTGASAAAIWSEALGRKVSYVGDDAIAGWLKHVGVPSWFAYDLTMMLNRFQSEGLVSTAEDVASMHELLGRPPRSYRDFAVEAAANWNALLGRPPQGYRDFAV